MILYNFFYGMYFPSIKPERVCYLTKYFEYLLYLTFRELPKDQKLYTHHIVPRSFLPESWRNKARGAWNNTIKVTREEHHKLHHILTYVYPTSGMAIANLKMYNNDRKLAPESVRKEAGQIVSEKSKKFYAEHPEARQHLSEIRKGKCFVNDGMTERFVYQEEAEQLVALGTWSYGMIKGRKKSEETKAKMKEVNGKALIGRKYIHLPGKHKTKFVFPSEIDFYIQRGWVIGRGSENMPLRKRTHHTEDSKKKISGTKKGKIFITNGIKNILIEKEELPSYQVKGWRKGKTLTEEYKEQARRRIKENPIFDREATSKANKGRTWKWVNKDGINKQIRPEQLNSYLAQGWVLGRKPKSIPTVEEIEKEEEGIS